MAAPRIQSIDAFKGLAIVAVLVIHTEPFLALDAMRSHWHWLGEAVQQLASFAIPFFFVTAGYFFAQGVERQGLRRRWWRYTSRLLALLLVWVLIDGVFWGAWLQEVVQTKSVSPLFWNALAIPEFAAVRPNLFLLRGTAVPLWFLTSLILAVNMLSLCIEARLNAWAIAFGAAGMYVFSLLTGSYSSTGLTLGFSLPLEERGPFIAFAFVAFGYLLSTHRPRIRVGGALLAMAMLMSFGEAALLSYWAGTPFQERAYLLSTVFLGPAVLAFAIQNPQLGESTVMAKIGQRSLGIYLVHTPLLGAFETIRALFISALWELLFPAMVLMLAYAIVLGLEHLPYLRRSVA